MNILITNTRAPGGLELARLLNNSGHRVFSFESFRFHLGLHSRAIIKNYHCSSPRFRPIDYINELNEVLTKENIEMIIPCFEESFYISKYRDDIKCSNIFVEKIEVLREIHHKFDFIKYCEKIGLSVPKSYLIESQSDFSTLGLLTEDFVFKPCFSRYGEDVLISPSEFLYKNGSWVCQKRIYGRSYCTYATCRAGKLTSLSIYPVEIIFGKVCTSFRALNSDAKDFKLMKEWILIFIEKISFTGQIGFDFIVDNEAFAIECNPRMTSGIHLFNNNSKFVNAFFEDQSLIEPVDNKQMNMTLLFLLTPRYFLQSLKFIFKGRDVIFKASDIWPFINQLSLFFYILVLSIKQNLSLSKITSHDIEWNGE